MNRRRRDQSPFSLFAFQDVMMTVMGIMLLMTLLLLLELTETVGEVVSQEPADAVEVETVAVDEAAVEARRREVERLRREFERTSEALEALGTSLPAARRQRAALAEELAELRAELEASDDEVRRLRAEIESDDAEHARELDRLAELHERIEQARAALDRYRRNPRLTYRVEPGMDRTPILVELSGGRVGIARHDEAGFALWITEEDAEGRRDAVVQFARSRSSREAYFVLLVKPSAFGEYAELRRALRSAGFRVGTEVIEEHVAAVAPLPGEGGGEGR